MKIISFSATTEAFVARQKSVTRRNWKPAHADSFLAGDVLQAWDHLPRCDTRRWRAASRPSPRRIGTIRLLRPPYLESSALAPGDDYDNEGFAYIDALNAETARIAPDASPILVQGMLPADLWADWHRRPRNVWVVRFEILELFATPGDLDSWRSSKARCSPDGR